MSGLQGTTGPGRAVSQARAGALAVVTPLGALVSRYLQWIQFVRERSANTIASYGFDLRRFEEFCTKAGIDHPEQIRLHLVEAYLAWLRHEKRYSIPTANRHRACLKGFFGYLLREEIIAKDPVTLTIPLKPPQRLPKRLTLRERDYVLDALAEDQTPLGRRDLAVIGLGSLAGLRCQEMATVRMEHLDLDSRIIRVIGKGDKEREIPLVNRLGAILEAYFDVRASLLGGPLGEVYRRTATSMWQIRYPGKGGTSTHVHTQSYSRRQAVAMLHALAPTVPESPYVIVNGNPRRGYALRRGGLPLETRSIFRIVRTRVSPLVGRPISPHVLRHTFASVLTERGASPFAVQRVMGHSRLETTGIYVHLSGETLRDEIETHLE